MDGYTLYSSPTFRHLCNNDSVYVLDLSKIQFHVYLSLPTTTFCQYLFVFNVLLLVFSFWGPSCISQAVVT